MGDSECEGGGGGERSSVPQQCKLVAKALVAITLLDALGTTSRLKDRVGQQGAVSLVRYDGTQPSKVL